MGWEWKCWATLLWFYLLSSACEGRLRIITSTSANQLFTEGQTATLECETSTPWFVCIWTGPGGLALHYGEGDNHGGCSPESGHRVCSRNGNRVCRLVIPEVRRSEAGGYRCVLADRDKVETVDRDLTMDVGFPVQSLRFPGGPVLPFELGEEMEVVCLCDGGNPPPDLHIYTNANISFKVKFYPFSSED